MERYEQEMNEYDWLLRTLTHLIKSEGSLLFSRKNTQKSGRHLGPPLLLLIDYLRNTSVNHAAEASTSFTVS